MNTAVDTRIIEFAEREYIQKGYSTPGLWPDCLVRTMNEEASAIRAALERLVLAGQLVIRDSIEFILDLSPSRHVELIREHNLAQAWDQGVGAAFYPNSPWGEVAQAHFRACLASKAAAARGRWSYAKMTPFAQRGHGIWFTADQATTPALTYQAESSFLAQACVIAFTTADQEGRAATKRDIQLVLVRAGCKDAPFWASKCRGALEAALAAT